MNKQTFVYKFDSYRARLGNWCLLRISAFCQLYCDYPTYWARSNDNHTMHLPHCISRWNRAVHPSEGFESKPLVQCNTDSLRDGPFNLKGVGLWFFSNKIFRFPMLLKKIFWFWWRKKKIIWFRKINILTLVLSEKNFLNETKNHKP